MTILKIKNVVKSFGGVRAVNKCSFAVPEGKITSIIGPNGAGKTTLFNIISGLLKCDAGSIFFQHQDITNKRPYHIARLGIARTFQLTRTFKNLSIKQNLLQAQYTSDSNLFKVLEQVHLKKDIHDTAGSLSYGQQRLLEIARAFLFPHSLLLLDEPTAGVNPRAFSRSIWTN